MVFNLFPTSHEVSRIELIKKLFIDIIYLLKNLFKIGLQLDII